MTDELLHRLWTKAVGTDNYVKAEWMALEKQLTDIARARDSACEMTQAIVDAQARYSPAAIAGGAEFKAMKREIDGRIAALLRVGK